MWETERERVELRNKEKNAETQEERTARAVADIEKEHHAKEVAELQAHRLQQDLQTSQRQVSEMADQLALAQRSKDNPETELDSIANETESSNSIAKMQCQYEMRITQLEGQLDEAESTRYWCRGSRSR